MKKKVVVSSEIVYVIAVLMLSFAVAMLSAANLGLSMIVSPAYILSQKLPVFSFGQCEYILQGIVFIVFCAAMKRIRLVYFFSFLTSLIYGGVLDMWRAVIPAFNPQVTSPGDFPFIVRGLFFLLGMLLTALAVALFFKTYLYPQVYDFFVKGISSRYHFDRTKCKRIMDACLLAIAVLMTLLFFGRFVGIGWGTLVMTVFNGILIGFFDRTLDRIFEFKPVFGKFAAKFEI